MFRYISEDIVFWLVKNKIIEIDDCEVYIYGLEALLLNTTNIITALIISILTNTISHFMVFLTVFVPLRVFAGGVHAKSSMSCYIYTTLLYGITVFLVKLCPLIYRNLPMQILFVIVIITIIALSPQKNQNHELDEETILRNKIVSIVLIILDSLIFIILYNLHNVTASSIIILIMVIPILLILEILKQHNIINYFVWIALEMELKLYKYTKLK